MNAIEHRLTTTVKTLIEANLPSGITSDFAIRAEYQIEKLERPYLCISSKSSGTPHPLIRKQVLTLTTMRRADDAATSPPEELHQRFVNAIESHLSDLATALSNVQLRLIKMVLGATTEEIVNGRGDSSTSSWTLWLQIL